MFLRIIFPVLFYWVICVWNNEQPAYEDIHLELLIDAEGKKSIKFKDITLDLEPFEVQHNITIAIQQNDKFIRSVHNVTQCYYKAKIKGNPISRGIISLCKGNTTREGIFVFDGIVETKDAFMLFNAFDNSQSMNISTKLDDCRLYEEVKKTTQFVTIGQVIVISKDVFNKGFQNNFKKTIDYAIRTVLTKNFILASRCIEIYLEELEIWTSNDLISITNIEDTLVKFEHHVRDVTQKRIPHNVTYLWPDEIKGVFGNKGGVSYKSSLLTKNISIAVIDMDANDALLCASYELHELLHMIGVGHDNSSVGYVMNEKTNPDLVPKFCLSKSTIEQLKTILPSFVKRWVTSNEHEKRDDVVDRIGNESWYSKYTTVENIGAVVVLGAVVVVVVVKWYKRKTQKPESNSTEDSNNEKKQSNNDNKPEKLSASDLQTKYEPNKFKPVARQETRLRKQGVSGIGSSGE